MPRLLALVVLAVGCGRIGFDERAPSDAAPTEPPWPTLAGQWTWIGGPDIGDQFGSYGSVGIPSATNQPGARDNGGAWQIGDTLYLFGGDGFGTTTRGPLADLWRYDTGLRQWTFLRGAREGSTFGVYGMKGVPSTTSNPGGRNDSVPWTDGAGRLWLFGGEGFAASGAEGSLGDLWRHDLAAGTWTWVGGPQLVDAVGVYDTLGGFSSTNQPSNRATSFRWVVGDELWIYGGYGIDENGARGALADLWRYDPVRDQWAWIAGSASPGIVPRHGTLGLAAPSNNPGRRDSGCAWQRPGELWLFGGSVGTFDINASDLWRYTISTGIWTWMGGPTTADHPGVFGERGAPGPDRIPGARGSQRCWQDLRGNFWLFGGRGVDRNGTIGSRNDLWVYQSELAQWTWVSGGELVDQPGTYGTLGVAAPTNLPGSRLPAAMWVHSDGSLWMFGGDYAQDRDGPANQLDDLWRFAAP